MCVFHLWYLRVHIFELVIYPVSPSKPFEYSIDSRLRFTIALNNYFPTKGSEFLPKQDFNMVKIHLNSVAGSLLHFACSLAYVRGSVSEKFPRSVLSIFLNSTGCLFVLRAALSWGRPLGNCRRASLPRAHGPEPPGTEVTSACPLCWDRTSKGNFPVLSIDRTNRSCGLEYPTNSRQKCGDFYINLGTWKALERSGSRLTSTFKLSFRLIEGIRGRCQFDTGP